LTKVSDRSFKLEGIKEPTVITIFDLLGKEIGSFNLNAAANEFKIPGASQGIFIISIRQSNKTLQVEKVLVLN
jgi:hypothetical protein